MYVGILYINTQIVKVEVFCEKTLFRSGPNMYVGILYIRVLDNQYIWKGAV